MGTPRGYVEIEGVTTVRETERGGLLIRTDDDREVWIPRAAVHDDSEVWSHADPDGRGPGTLVIPERLAIDKDLV